MEFLAPDWVVHSDKEGRSLHVSGFGVFGDRFSHGFFPELQDARFLYPYTKVGI